MKRIIFILAALAICAAASGQTDSLGVYAVKDGTAEKIDVLNYTQTKIKGGMLKSTARLEFPEASSSMHFQDTAVLRLYFGTPSPAQVARYYMFAPSYSAKDFAVAAFQVKGGRRYLVTAKVSVFGSKIGTESAKDVQTEVRKIREGVYEVKVAGPAGEYCIAPIIGGSAGFAGVFDFAID